MTGSLPASTGEGWRRRTGRTSFPGLFSSLERQGIRLLLGPPPPKNRHARCASTLTPGFPCYFWRTT